MPLIILWRAEFASYACRSFNFRRRILTTVDVVTTAGVVG